MNKTQKIEVSKELKDRFSKAKIAIFANYRGLTAMDADILRKELRAADTEVKVIKNNLLRVVSKDGSMGPAIKDLADSVTGPTLVAFGYKDVAQTAKVIKKFSDSHEAFQVQESWMEQKRISVQEVEQLADLPSREVLIAKLLGTLNAPIRNFVSVLAAVPRSAVTVLAAIEKKKTENS